MLAIRRLLRNKPCLLCEQSSSSIEPICNACEMDLPWLGARCQRCALPLSCNAAACGQCLKLAPAFTQVHAAWLYAFPINALINRFKHHAHWPMGHLLTALLAQHLQLLFTQGTPRPDALTPVPLGPARQRQRGFNQALLIARWLSKRLNVPLRTDLLWRTRETQDQQSLNAKQRHANLRHAFSLRPGAQCNGLHIALIDDVMTTGSTVQCLSQLLLKAGAASVSVYCLARTAKPGEPS